MIEAMLSVTSWRPRPEAYRSRGPLVLAIACACVFMPLAQDAPGSGSIRRDLDGTRIIVVSTATSAAAESFAEGLGAALAQGFVAAGYGRVDRAGTPEAEMGTAAAGGLAGDGLPASGSQTAGEADVDQKLALHLISGNKARWVAIARCTVDKRRVNWRATVFDMADGAIVASDAGTAFAGLSAMSAIDESAARVVRDAASQRDRPLPEETIDYRLTFRSQDEGARIFFGEGRDSFFAGTVVDGVMVAPYMPFTEGEDIIITITSPTGWPRTVTIQPPEEGKAIRLPAMKVRSTHTLGLGTTIGRLLGVAADYRYHLSPDVVFLRAGAHFWVQPTDSGLDPASAPSWPRHSELRLGLGYYPLLAPDSFFKLGTGFGISAMRTRLVSDALVADTFMDISLDGPWLTLEFHLPRLAVYLEQRAGYSFGVTGGLLRQGWWRTGTMPMLVGAGAILKW